MIGLIVLGVTALFLIKANKLQETHKDGAAILCYFGGMLFLFVVAALFT